jgi:hypothetical protein
MDGVIGRMGRRFASCSPLFELATRTFLVKRGLRRVLLISAIIWMREVSQRQPNALIIKYAYQFEVPSHRFEIAGQCGDIQLSLVLYARYLWLWHSKGLGQLFLGERTSTSQLSECLLKRQLLRLSLAAARLHSATALWVAVGISPNLPPRAVSSHDQPPNSRGAG